jgi:hypothetical protein
MDYWQQLSLEIIGPLIGTFAGALMAFSSERRSRRSEVQSREQAALSGLVADLNQKRALRPGELQSVDPAAGGHDIERCAQSVLHTRELIRDARINLRPGSEAFEYLISMTASCNTYLREARMDPALYQYALARLHASLDSCVRALSNLPGVAYRPPGGSAYAKDEKTGAPPSGV